MLEGLFSLPYLFIFLIAVGIILLLIGIIKKIKTILILGIIIAFGFGLLYVLRLFGITLGI